MKRKQSIIVASVLGVAGLALGYIYREAILKKASKLITHVTSKVKRSPEPENGVS